MARAEVECKQRNLEKKKLKMNLFAPGPSIANILVHPPFQYILQKLGSFNFVKLWYFTLEGYMNTTKSKSKSQADDTFGISRVNDHLTVHSIIAS